MSSDALVCLLLVGSTGGPSTDDALRALRDLRMLPEQGHAIDELLRIHASTPLPEPLLVAVASELVDRGDVAAAAGALSGTSSPPALLMRADLLARAGDTADAAATVEQVLARDIDWPGARERWTRWTGQAGSARATHPADTTGAVPWPSRADDGPLDVAGVRSNGIDPGDETYRRVREVARGGTATVYEALDRNLDRRVALKVYHRPDRDHALLVHEAQVAIVLAGEGIVRILDVDVNDGWLAMQWCAAGTLNLRASSGALGARESAIAMFTSWVSALARALARAHARGWVHNDVKPANVLLTASRAALLTDFGIARRTGEPSPTGSLGHVSPERAAGRPSDPRDDVYGFGRVLEEGLSPGGALATLGLGDALASLRAVAAACTGPDADRPRDGTELVTLLAHG
jgi:tRNA A-37 threonylcarbamoyl transferase component Bud32